MVTPWNLGPPKMDFSVIGDLGKTFQSSYDAQRKRELEEQQRTVYAGLGSDIERGDYAGAARKVMGLGDLRGGVSLLGLGQKAEDRKLELEAYKNSPFSGGVIGVPTVAPTQSSAPVATGTPNEIETQFVNGVRSAGLTNPVGLAAVAAYGRAESGYSPGNVNRTWNDPSESGKSGTSGGIMSWRADRLQNLHRFAQGRGEQPNNISPATQAAFLAQEDPQLIPRLNAAKSPEEANQIMANAWRFAGYDRPGGENSRRLALTKHYASRYGQSGAYDAASGQPVAGQRPVQVAETEADVQRLEAEQAARASPAQAGGTYAQSTTEQLQEFLASPRVPENYKAMMRTELAQRQGGQAPVQVAEAAPQAGAPMADVPAQGAANAEFNIPGNAIPPNDPYPQVTNQQLINVLRNPRSSAGDKTLAQQIFASRQAYSAENAPDKREAVRLQNEKARREIQGKQFRVLTSEERAAAGVDPTYKGVVQIDRDGQLHFPGKASAEVNVKNEGTIPPGYRMKRDAQGNPTELEPIPGGPAAAKVDAATEKERLTKEASRNTGNVVITALDDIDRLMKEATLPTTGAVGSRVAEIKGTAAHDIKSALATIGANISFDKLAQMRAASPTGGALGAVTENELAMLQNSLASLQQSQSDGQFRANLGRVRAAFERTVHGRTLTAQERKGGGPMTMERAKSLRDEAAAAIAGGAPKEEVAKRLKEKYGITPEGL